VHVAKWERCLAASNSRSSGWNVSTSTGIAFPLEVRRKTIALWQA